MQVGGTFIRMKQTKTMRNLSGFILHLHSCDILYKIAVWNTYKMLIFII